MSQDTRVDTGRRWASGAQWLIINTCTTTVPPYQKKGMTLEYVTKRSSPMGYSLGVRNELDNIPTCNMNSGFIPNCKKGCFTPNYI